MKKKFTFLSSEERNEARKREKGAHAPAAAQPLARTLSSLACSRLLYKIHILGGEKQDARGLKGARAPAKAKPPRARVCRSHYYIRPRLTCVSTAAKRVARSLTAFFPVFFLHVRIADVTRGRANCVFFRLMCDLESGGVISHLCPSTWDPLRSQRSRVGEKGLCEERQGAGCGNVWISSWVVWKICVDVVFNVGGGRVELIIIQMVFENVFDEFFLTQEEVWVYSRLVEFC